MMLFQSAMRIFGGFNQDSRARRGMMIWVSIRHADFRWFQLRPAGGDLPAGCSFNPPCGFSVVSTSSSRRDLPLLNVSIRHADFRWFQPLRQRSRTSAGMVSIRHADFRWFQPLWNSKRSMKMIFVSIRHADFRWFQHQPKIEVVGPIEVSIRHADFRWFQRIDVLRKELP